MNELQAVCEAYATARARSERTALATVVQVEGSAYRRPGARMLITERGHTAGSISGGCLERDVLEHAAQVMQTGAAQIIEYDTRGSEDIVWGLGLGCNGVVRILLESLHEGSTGTRALQYIAACLHARKAGIMPTVIRKMETTKHENDTYHIGARFMFAEHGLNDYARSFAADLDARIRADAQTALREGRPMLRAYETSALRIEIFFDVLMPPRALIIFGAEQDALPVVQQARLLGWHVTVVDTRARNATLERFSAADEVVLCRAESVAAHIALPTDAAAVVMTHNYLDDVALVATLLPSPLPYIGLLGPKQRTAKLLAELRASNVLLTDAQLARLHSPIGMDIGAETPAEIALAISAEIKAVSATRGGGFLRERNAPIHDERASQLVVRDFPLAPRAAVRASASVMGCRAS